MIPGYTFIPMLDSAGSDITQLAMASLNQRATACSTDARCVGFNCDGWLKFEIRPRAQWYYASMNPCYGLHIKGTAPTFVMLAWIVCMTLFRIDCSGYPPT